MTKQNKKPNSNFLLKLIILVIFIWGLSAVLIMYFLSDWANRGTFGDLFGAINALFSALAFAVLIYTIVLQKEELNRIGKNLY